MHRRDKHFLYVEVGLTSLCLLVCAASVWFVLCWVRRTNARLDGFGAEVDACRQFCADASGAAQNAASVNAAPVLSEDDSPVEPPKPRLVGTGQTKSRTHRYAYFDIEDGYGNVDRRYQKLWPLEIENTPPDIRTNENFLASESQKY